MAGGDVDCRPGPSSQDRTPTFRCTIHSKSGSKRRHDSTSIIIIKRTALQTRIVLRAFAYIIATRLVITALRVIARGSTVRGLCYGLQDRAESWRSYQRQWKERRGLDRRLWQGSCFGELFPRKSLLFQSAVAPGAEALFQAFKDHKIVDPFYLPGQCDLTVNVDFAYLKEAMTGLSGVISSRYYDQVY